MGDLLNRIKGNIIERRNRLKEGKINLNELTPIDALNILVKMKDKIK